MWSLDLYYNINVRRNIASNRRCLTACVMRQITADSNCQTTPGSCLHCISGLLFSLKRVKPIITARKIPKIDNNYWNSYNNFVSHFVCCWWPKVNRRKSDGQSQSTVNHQSVFGETEFGQLMVKSDFGGWLNCCQMLVKFGLSILIMLMSVVHWEAFFVWKLCHALL